MQTRSPKYLTKGKDIGFGLLAHDQEIDEGIRTWKKLDRVKVRNYNSIFFDLKL